MTRRAAYGLHSPEVAAWYREMAFASACSMRIACCRPARGGRRTAFASACSMRIAFASCKGTANTLELCLSVLHADCIGTFGKYVQGWGFFASACSMRIASLLRQQRRASRNLCLSVLHADCIFIRPSFDKRVDLCLSVLHADCIGEQAPEKEIHHALPQRAPCGLHLSDGSL